MSVFKKVPPTGGGTPCNSMLLLSPVRTDPIFKIARNMEHPRPRRTPIRAVCRKDKQLTGYCPRVLRSRISKHALTCRSKEM